ncbi:MAG: ABC-F family ATP-binding cassette domain-containing protein, partial [Pseudomonadota bacterium]
TVSQILAFEGDGRVEGYIGGYSDYLETLGKVKAKEKAKNKDKNKDKSQNKSAHNTAAKAQGTDKAGQPASKPAGKLSFKLKYELENLPKKIAEQEQIVADLNTALANPDFYQQDPEAFHQATQDLTAAQARLERYETRWLELEDMRDSVAAD